MASDTHPRALAARGLSCLRPTEDDQRECSRIIMEELVLGVLRPASVRFLEELTGRLRDAGCDAIVLGCTELPLVLHDGNAALPTLDSTRLLARAALRRALDAWFAAERLRPVVVGEMDDGALLAAVAAHGRGVFVVPSVVAGDARREHGAVVVGATDAVRERVFAVTAGRTRDPSLAALLAAR